MYLLGLGASETIFIYMGSLQHDMNIAFHFILGSQMVITDISEEEGMFYCVWEKLVLSV